MRKFVSIFLIILFLFNLFGYRIAFFYELQQSDKRLESSFDENQYKESELLTIRVPLSLPYLPDNTAFERTDGEVKIDGKIYKYVKRRISEGELVLLCLPDYDKMRLQSEANDTYKSENLEVPNTSSSKKSGDSKGACFKNIFSEFNKGEAEFSSARFFFHKKNNLDKPSNKLSATPRTTVEQPPEMA